MVEVKKVYRKHKCGLCGKEHDVFYMLLGNDGYPLYGDSYVSLSKRVDGESQIYNYQVCPECADAVWKLIVDRM